MLISSSLVAKSLISTTTMILTPQSIAPIVKTGKQILEGGFAGLSSPAVALALRGGSAVLEASLDPNRIKMKTEALGGYSVVSVLLLSQTMSLLNSAPKKLKNADDGKHFKIENAAIILLAVMSLVSVISCMTTTFSFSLIGMYAKNAVGMDNDAGYLKFLEATSKIRVTGFRSMVLSLYSMQIAFVISIFLKFKGKLMFILGPAALTLTVLSTSWWGPIIKIASETVF